MLMPCGCVTAGPGTGWDWFHHPPLPVLNAETMAPVSRPVFMLGPYLPPELLRCCDAWKRVRFRAVVAVCLFSWVMFPVSAGADGTKPPSGLPEHQGKPSGQHSPTHANCCQELRSLTHCFLCSRLNGPPELRPRRPEGAGGKAV